MKPRHQVSRAAIELIKRFEGYRRKAAQLADGRWTIGYGHTLTARRDAEVSEQDAEALLLYDLIGVAHVVNQQTFATLAQNQFDALCAFAFGIGLDNFRRSDVLKRINEGQAIQAAFAMELWRKAEFEGERIVIDALVRRRAAEKLLFLTPPGEAWTPAPSAILRPLLDLDGFDAGPRQAPAPVVATLEGEEIRVRRQAPATPPSIGSQAPEHPVTAAMEAVTARLQTLFPDAAGQTQPEEPLASGQGGAPEPELFETAPPANGAQPQRPPGVADRRGDPVLIDDTAPFEFVPQAVQPLPPQPANGLLTVAGLIVLGLTFFSGGLFWGLNARPTRDGGLFAPVLVGWLAGIAGVVLLAAAVYLLLQRLGRAAERRSEHPRT